MMIHVATLTASLSTDSVRLLDPLAGKGTTLYEAAMCGYDAYGVEIGEKPATEAYQFMRKYLEMERHKHTCSSARVSGENRSFTAHRNTIQYARDKDELKTTPRRWEMVNGDSRFCDRYFRKEFFDVIVGDMPYGVQHGNVTQQSQSSLTRNPSELVLACAPAWHAVLKPGGALALAWNSFVLSREALTQLLEAHGFSVCQEGPYLAFEHRVDNAIRRDVLVARKIKSVK